jgi:hypothetical protein
MSQLRRKFQEKLHVKQDVLYTIAGVLGNGFGIVKVPNRNNYVYVRLAGTGLAEVYNNRVVATNDLPIICGYDSANPTKFQILSIQGAIAESASFSTGVIGYAPASRYRWMFPGGGQDPLFSELRQLLPLRITPTSAMSFNVHKQVIFNGTEWEIFGGGQSYDLASYIPATSGKCKMVLISIDEVGDIQITAGSEVNIADLAVTDIPSPPEGTRYVLGAIRLYYGQTLIQEARTNTDITDLRFPQISGGGGASALSDLTDVDLTDLADGDVLVYDETSGGWLPETPASGGTIIVEEVDESPSVSNVEKIIFPNGSLTDNEDGSVSIEFPASGSALTVQEIDETPSVANVTVINITNGTLTDEGGGEITIEFGDAATDGSAIHDNEANEISAITEKEEPVAGDLIIVEDSEDGYTKKSVDIANLPGGSSGMENPMTTAGDIIYGGASGTPTRLGKGAAGYYLKQGASVPEWAAVSGGGYPYQILVPIIFPSASSGTVTKQRTANYFLGHRIYTLDQNNYLEYPILMAAGTWRLDHITDRNLDRAIHTVSLDGSNVGTYDCYAAGVLTYDIYYSITGISVATAGVKLLRFTAATKNASSSSYTMVLSYICLTRTE